MIKIKVSFEYVIDHGYLEKYNPDNPFLVQVKKDRQKVVDRVIVFLECDIETYLLREDFFERIENLRVYEDKKQPKMIRVKASFDYVIDYEKLERFDPDNPFLIEVKENKRGVVDKCITFLREEIEAYFGSRKFEYLEKLNIYEDKGQPKKSYKRT